MDRSSFLFWAEALSPTRGLTSQPGAMAYRVNVKSVIVAPCHQPGSITAQRTEQ